MGFDAVVKNTKASLNPFEKENRRNALQAAYDPAEFTRKPKVPELETPPPLPTQADAVQSATVSEARKKKRSRASTIFTSNRGDTSAASTASAVLLGD